MKCLERLLTLSLNLIILSFFLFAPSLGATVRLKQKALVTKSNVTLNDVSEINGTDVEKELLSSIPIGEVPPCSHKTFSKTEIANLIANFLRENGISFKEIKLTGSPIVKVTFECVQIDQDHLKKLILSYMKRNYPNYEVTSVPTIVLKLPKTNYKEYLNLESMGRTYARFTYEIRINGKTYRKFWIPIKIERKVKVIVATKPIVRGSKITADEISLKEVRESLARGGTDDLRLVLGAKARRDILPGEVIKERDIYSNFQVKKGLPVRIVYLKGNLRIELLGIALQNGNEGDIIKVKNPSTGKVVLCKVLGNGLVEFVSD